MFMQRKYRGTRIALLSITLGWVLASSTTALVEITEKFTEEKTEVQPLTPKEIQAQITWSRFCSALGHYARVRATLRDQGVDKDRVFPHMDKVDDERVQEVMKMAVDFAYSSPDTPPKMVAAEVEVTCLETKEK